MHRIALSLWGKGAYLKSYMLLTAFQGVPGPAGPAGPKGEPGDAGLPGQVSNNLLFSLEHMLYLSLICSTKYFCSSKYWLNFPNIHCF